MSTQTLFLFDVDGVLVHHAGYYESLRATVDHFAQKMGQKPVAITNEEIALLESYGLTNEWDSVPFCVAILLNTILKDAPALIDDSFVETLDKIAASGVKSHRPNFSSEAARFLNALKDTSYPAKHIQKQLEADSPENAHVIWAELFADIYAITTPTTQIFQHYTLGSTAFNEVYDLPPLFETESYLKRFDQSALSAEMREKIVAYHQSNTEHNIFRSVVYTARPSYPPIDLTASEKQDLNPHRYPPEAEFALDVIGLKGELPLISGGRITWLAGRQGKHISDYIKPSPVQALAAIGAAVGGGEIAALETAAQFYETGQLGSLSTQLKDKETLVVVFEDSMGGIRAVQGAVELLKDAGLSIRYEAVGIANEQSKQARLAEVADRVVDDINEAAARYLPD